MASWPHGLMASWPHGLMGAWGQGSLRERRPGVFEIRIAIGVDPVWGRTVQRSFWFHGTATDAEERRRELAAQFAEYRSTRRAAPFLTVGELLERWLAAQHDWRPSTWTSARSNAKALSVDAIAGRRVATLRPEVVRVTMARWHGLRGHRVGDLRTFPGTPVSPGLGPGRIDHRQEPAPGHAGSPTTGDAHACARTRRPCNHPPVAGAGGEGRGRHGRIGALVEGPPQGRTGPAARAAGG